MIECFAKFKLTLSYHYLQLEGYTLIQSLCSFLLDKHSRMHAYNTFKTEF